MIEQHTRAEAGTRLSEVVAAIALAADLGLGQPLEFVLRSCVLATRFGEHLELAQEDRDAAYWVTLFFAAGCTGASFELSKIFGDDIAFRSKIFDVDPKTVAILRFIVGQAGSHQPPLPRMRTLAALFAHRMTPLEQTFVAHCAVSARLAERLSLGETVVASLWQIFTRWDGKGFPKGLGGDDIFLPAQIANIANTAAHGAQRGARA